MFSLQGTVVRRRRTPGAAGYALIYGATLPFLLSQTVSKRRLSQSNPAAPVSGLYGAERRTGRDFRGLRFTVHYEQ
ncbi:helix-turn-helix domain-containing protein [Pantoea sp. S62]|nr:helix-turn-helix domain-containing protein [Pantoea sp. S62]